MIEVWHVVDVESGGDADAVCGFIGDGGHSDGAATEVVFESEDTVSGVVVLECEFESVVVGHGAGGGEEAVLKRSAV